MSAPFHVSNVFDDVSDGAWFHSALLSDVIDQHAPLKTKTVMRDSVPYMNGRLRKSLYQRNMARNKFKRFGAQYWEENRRQRNAVVSIRKQSMAAYFEQRCQQTNQTFWKTVSPFMTDKHFKNGEKITLCENDKIVIANNDVANIFNNYFANVASSIGFNDNFVDTKNSIEKHSSHPSIVKIRGRFGDRSDSFSFKCVDPHVIAKKLGSLNIRKATGYDNIPAKLLRLASDELAAPLASLINKCLLSNMFPDTMKCAELGPVYKKGDNLIKENYRPVSILTAISKLYESVLNDQLSSHFSDIFDNLLSAFRKGYSCQSLLIKCVDDWKVCLDKNEIVGLLFMDLSIAFDCLPHSLLIAKLHAYGLDISACDLMSSYLTDRQQRVKIGNCKSEWLPVTKGVPQGSILGPVLFNIFMNDLFLFIERCSLYNYADDNSLSARSACLSEVISSIQHDGNISTKWFTDNGMAANPDKFQCILLSRNKLDVQDITLKGDAVIKSENHVKVLGVTIDNKLDFSEHTALMCRKAARQLNALSRISRFLNVSSRRIIYQSFIASNFTYCPVVWHFCGKVNNSKIEKIHERALRIIHCDYSSSYEELLNMTGASTCLASRLKTLTLEVFKSVTNRNPTPLSDLFIVKDTNYDLRQKLRLIQPKRETSRYGLRSFSYLGAKLWNELPIDSNYISNMSPDEFKSFLSKRPVPDCEFIV